MLGSANENQCLVPAITGPDELFQELQPPEIKRNDSKSTYLLIPVEEKSLGLTLVFPEMCIPPSGWR